jgi:NADPH-dependent glutamate synthase beta subunit-like oxidoreductase/NAD(P)H-flavin reductase
MIEKLNLAFDISFKELYSQKGLENLDRIFCEWLQNSNLALFNSLMSARSQHHELPNKQASDLLVELAPLCEQFIGEIFGISDEIDALHQQYIELKPLPKIRRNFIERDALRKYKVADVEHIDIKLVKDKLDNLLGRAWIERDFAYKVTAWLYNEEQFKNELDLARQYTAWAVHSVEGRTNHQYDTLFKIPHKLNFENLVAVETVVKNGVTQMRLPDEKIRHRDGFSLTDDGGSHAQIMQEANYCIWCHKQEKDSCSTGLKDRKTGDFKQNSLSATLTGCPLEEKISEMNLAISEGYVLGALALVTIDNPMLAATGHRICNDCMKACIYQKQQPVNIPEIETRTLKDILDLPWGFEIYSLLTRWNPLNFSRPMPKPTTNYKVLVAGMGPAGFTLAHHLMNDGHHVVGIDGLKIEPLSRELKELHPIKNWRNITEDLDDRIVGGFGGVAEYGITVRWNKNYLKLIRILLERRAEFMLFGGTRFGGTITMNQAFAMGFDHVALAMGAGKPRMVAMKNGLARGVRQASDFLMALQLTGAAKKSSLANLQLRLPIVVIGGGLTAIDTATESMAYYIRQVEKFAYRYQKLVDEFGAENVRAKWSEEDSEIAATFLKHAEAITIERKQDRPDLVRLIRQWGGVSIIYRRKLTEAPSYRLNHEEVEKALEEGIGFIENLTPTAIEIDRFWHADQLICTNSETKEEVIIAAKSVLIAAGTQPNTVLAREDTANEILLDGKYFKAYDEAGKPIEPQPLPKPDAPHVLMHTHKSGQKVSFFGDLHPSYAGNVVKAMGSAKQGYPVVTRLLEQRKPHSKSPAALFSEIKHGLTATIHSIDYLTSNIIEVVLHAPFAAQNFEPGQFYRLQNFESYAPRTDDTVLAMEGIALTGAWVDKDKGLISTIILEMGGSSSLCSLLNIGEEVTLMGPTGAPTTIPKNKTVLLAGGGLGNAVLFAIGKAMRDNGCRVLYFAAYKKPEDRYKREEIEAAADHVIWCSDVAPGFAPSRPADYNYVGNVVEAMQAYGAGKLGEAPIALKDIARIIAIGSDRMMAAVASARHTILASYLNPKHVAIGSINSPMQCMMKEICAQCLQPHKDPATGAITYVFSCFDQDQNLDQVDFAGLHERLSQNALQEKLTTQWIDYCRKT